MASVEFYMSIVSLVNANQSMKVSYLNSQYLALKEQYPKLTVLDERPIVGHINGTQWFINSTYSTDGVHFNNLGYDILGRAVYNDFTSTINSSLP